MEIIPAINCQTADEARERAEKAGGFAEWVHLDVADANFTFNKTWGDAAEWPKFGGRLKLEVHLMVENPEKEIDAWLAAGAKRVIIHLETINEETFSEIKKKTDAKGAELMLSSNPETPAEKFEPYYGRTSGFQILAVYPGLSGQRFLPLVTHKIILLRREMPDAKIEVDGGINEETARIAKLAGADIAVSGSYIFNNPDPKGAYEKLKSV